MRFPFGILSIFFRTLSLFFSVFQTLSVSSNSSSLASGWERTRFKTFWMQSCSASRGPGSRSDNRTADVSSPASRSRSTDTRACSEFALTIVFFSFVPLTRRGTSDFIRLMGRGFCIFFDRYIDDAAADCFTSLLL